MPRERSKSGAKRFLRWIVIERSSAATWGFLVIARQKIPDAMTSAFGTTIASPIARIFIDDAMGVPVRFESYDWPTIDDGRPVLQEEYTYRDLKLNVGLSDEDFDPEYPDYRFR